MPTRIMKWTALCMLVLVVACPSILSAQEARKPPEKLDTAGNVQYLSSHGFQSAITTDKNLAKLAGETDFLGAESVSFGFGAKSPEARFFILGALYSQTLAYLNGGDIKSAAERLKAIEGEFIGLQAPTSLYNFVSKTRNMIERGDYTREVINEFLILFQPFLEDYALASGKDMPLLLHAGSWLVDFGLAAAGRDEVMLRQSAKLRYLTEEMKRMDAPKGVVDSMQELAEITAKDEISDRDVKKILKLVQDIQTVLG